jgi:hypothetical protein
MTKHLLCIVECRIVASCYKWWNPSFLHAKKNWTELTSFIGPLKFVCCLNFNLLQHPLLLMQSVPTYFYFCYSFLTCPFLSGLITRKKVCIFHFYFLEFMKCLNITPKVKKKLNHLKLIKIIIKHFVVK